MAGDLKANWYLEGGPTFVFEYILNLYLYLYIYLYMHLYLYLLGVKRQETWKPIMLLWIHQYLSTSPSLLPSLHALNREISLCSWRQVSVWSTWTLHLTQVASGGLSSGGKESSQAVEVVRTIVPPKPTVVPRPPPGLNGRWRALLPGRRSLGQGHQGPHNILEIFFTNFVLFSISLGRYPAQHKCQASHTSYDLLVKEKEGPRKKSSRSQQMKCFW